jgi:hypothetical protein
MGIPGEDGGKMVTWYAKLTAEADVAARRGARIGRPGWVPPWNLAARP